MHDFCVCERSFCWQAMQRDYMKARWYEGSSNAVRVYPEFSKPFDAADWTLVVVHLTC